MVIGMSNSTSLTFMGIKSKIANANVMLWPIVKAVINTNSFFQSLMEKSAHRATRNKI